PTLHHTTSLSVLVNHPEKPEMWKENSLGGSFRSVSGSGTYQHILAGGQSAKPSSSPPPAAGSSPSAPNAMVSSTGQGTVGQGSPANPHRNSDRVRSRLSLQPAPVNPRLTIDPDSFNPLTDWTISDDARGRGRGGRPSRGRRSPYVELDYNEL